MHVHEKVLADTKICVLIMRTQKQGYLPYAPDATARDVLYEEMVGKR
jgi:hypothetical protein